MSRARQRPFAAVVAVVVAVAVPTAGCGDDVAVDPPAGSSTVESVGGSTEGPSVDSATTPASDAPYAWINGPYTARVGSPVTLDGSGSYAADGFLVAYDWDYDADGTADETTARPTVTHTWTTEYTGPVVLMVTDTAGRTGAATTRVAITDDGDEVPPGDDNCPEVENQGQDDEDADGVGDACDETPGFPTEDQSGVVEGTD